MNLLYFIKVAWGIIMLSVVLGCQTAPVYVNNEPKPQPQTVAVPQTNKSVTNDPEFCKSNFGIAILTENYVIVDHKVLDNNPSLGKLRFAGKYQFVPPYVLFKFKAVNCPNTYWIGKVETVPQGRQEVRTEQREEPSYQLRPESPPCLVEVGTNIVNGRFEQSFIKNPHPGWGPFKTERYQKPILTYSNWHFPGCEWDAKVPMSDGQGVLKFVLRDGSCEIPSVQSCGR